MVSLLGGLSAAGLAARLETFLGKKIGGGGGPISQRALAKQIGIPRTTLQDLLRDPSRRRPATIAKIAEALTSKAAQVTTQMARTARVDAPLFTRESLRGLSRPDNAMGFRFVVVDDRYPEGYATTITDMNPNSSPADALGLIGDDVDSIVSVVWVYR